MVSSCSMLHGPRAPGFPVRPQRSRLEFPGPGLPYPLWLGLEYKECNLAFGFLVCCFSWVACRLAVIKRNRPGVQGDGIPHLIYLIGLHTLSLLCVWLCPLGLLPCLWFVVCVAWLMLLLCVMIGLRSCSSVFIG